MAIPSPMSFLNQLRQISVFDEGTYRKAAAEADGPFRVLIKPLKARAGQDEPDVGVKGILQAPMSFSMAANWDTLGLENVFSSLTSQNKVLEAAAAAVKTTMGAAGTSLTNSGLFTKKIYTKSDYLNFDVKFRVLDWDDDAMPVRTAQTMIALCVPRKALGQKIREIFPEGSPLQKGTKWFENGLAEAKQKIGPGVLKETLNTMQAGSNEVLGGEVNLTHAPTPVQVSVGRWFVCEDAVITQIGVEFAEQSTVAGPQYADFTVSMSSREMVIMDENGLRGLKFGAKTRNRVKIATGVLDSVQA